MSTDPNVRRFLPPGPLPTMDAFHGAMEQRRVMEREHRYAMSAVDFKEPGTFVGQCGLQPVERTGPEVEIAYHFNKASWNKGYATEAAIAVLALGLGPVALDRVIAVIVPENIGSWRVVEKAGMRFVGTATYYGKLGLKKYVAEREWWKPPHLAFELRQERTTALQASNEEGVVGEFELWRLADSRPGASQRSSSANASRRSLLCRSNACRGLRGSFIILISCVSSRATCSVWVSRRLLFRMYNEWSRLT
jgi:[ribosomal protein S5]-alanine N-acetyltransferase